jgi:D-sedoheptulose 7-phosphate isomerase
MATRTSTLLTTYLDQESRLLECLKEQEALVTRLADEIVDRTLSGQKIILFGNGGSATTSSHIVCDLTKGTTSPGKTNGRVKTRALCLTDNISMVTAWANDESYEDIFAQQIEAYCESGDLVIALSGSGNSVNVLKGVSVAKGRGALCFALCGFDGGKLSRLADHAIIIPGENIQQAEDVHLIALHLVFLMVRERLHEASNEDSGHLQ